MKMTRKQKIDRQREYAAERAIGPIRDAIDSGELVISPAPQRQPRVKIVGREHPHFGEYGRFTGEVKQFPWGSKLALVKLENCKHGGDACYISPGDIREVNDDDQYI